jgi:hypothetical protein
MLILHLCIFKSFFLCTGVRGAGLSVSCAVRGMYAHGIAFRVVWMGRVDAREM